MKEGIASAPLEALQREAQQLLPIVRHQARRAYVVEIAGTPKAGKSTTIAMLQSFLRTFGWRVEVLRETAAKCPLPMKGHFFFNTWTTATMLAGLLETVDRALDLIIVDRGLFDAIVWLELQRRRGQVSTEEATAFSDFVLLDRWRQLVDASFVMEVSPRVAMDREQHDRLVSRTGTIMNEDALTQFNATLTECRASLSSAFSFHYIDGDSKDRKEIALALLRELLARVRDRVDPDVAGAPRVLMEKITAGNKSMPWTRWEVLKSHITTRRRSDAEADPRWVQFMACGVLRFDDGVFVFDRTDVTKISRYGKSAIWRSLHVEAETEEHVRDAAWIGESLRRRLAETLYVQVGFGEPRPLGLVWDPETEPQHAAIVFSVSVESRSVAESLAEKEFKTSGRRNPMSSRFVSLRQISAETAELESWSRTILEEQWVR
jgi:predicted NUDIX family phosphoesterase